jgi:hypothetical protein
VCKQRDMDVRIVVNMIVSFLGPPSRFSSAYNWAG